MWYLEAAILEAMWKILKLVGREKMDRVRRGFGATVWKTGCPTARLRVNSRRGLGLGVCVVFVAYFF